MQAYINEGKILIKPYLGNSGHLVETNDPYIIFCLGDQRVKSSICYDSPKIPYWDDIIILAQNNDNSTLIIELWDYESLQNDKFVGYAQLSLEEISRRYKTNKSIQFFNKQKKIVGTIMLDITFHSFIGNWDSCCRLQIPEFFIFNKNNSSLKYSSEIIETEINYPHGHQLQKNSNC